MKCDKCDKEVPWENDATILDAIRIEQPIVILMWRARHLFPVDGCEGSPSRAQYLGGEPDTRGYELDESRIPEYKKAYEELLKGD